MMQGCTFLLFLVKNKEQKKDCRLSLFSTDLLLQQFGNVCAVSYEGYEEYLLSKKIYSKVCSGFGDFNIYSSQFQQF